MMPASETRTPVLFWDVDTQVDFMEPDGALHVPGAEALIPRLSQLARAAREHGIPVVASADDHELGDAEISAQPDWETTYPPHCMRGTPGSERIAATRPLQAVEVGHRPLSRFTLQDQLRRARVAVILKKTVDVFSNPNTETLLEILRPQRVIVYGVALDICDRLAVEGLWERGYRDLTVVTDAVAALDRERGQRLLDDWARRGIELLTTEEVLDHLELGKLPLQPSRRRSSRRVAHAATAARLVTRA